MQTSPARVAEVCWRIGPSWSRVRALLARRTELGLALASPSSSCWRADCLSRRRSWDLHRGGLGGADGRPTNGGRSRMTDLRPILCRRRQAVAHDGRCRAGARRRARRVRLRGACQPHGRGPVRLAAARRPHRLHEPGSRAAGRGRPGARLRRQTRAVELHERVPVERRLLATRRPSRSTAIGRRWPGAADLVPRSERAGPARAHARGFRRQRQPRAAHPARLAAGASSRRCRARPRTTPQARERFLKVMGEQAERMTRLIDDLLSLSRVEMREHLPPAERVDLNDAVAHVIQSLQPIAGQTGTTHRVPPAGGAGHRSRRQRRDRAGVPEPGAERHQVRQARRAHRGCASRASRPAAAARPASSSR